MGVLGWRMEERRGREAKNAESSLDEASFEKERGCKGVSCSSVMVTGRQKREGSARKLLNASWSSAEAAVVSEMFEEVVILETCLIFRTAL